MLALLPSLVHAAQDKTEINGLYFDLFDNYGTGTCRFTADFGESGMQSTYTGNIVIPGTVPYNNKTYTVTTLGASVFERANVTSVYIPNTITAIENLSNVPSMKGIMCNIADPNTIKDSPQSFGKTISESNSNLYKLGSYTDNCVLVVPAGSKSSYTSNGWGTVFKGGIYEGIVIIADNKSMTYGDNIPQLTWSHFKVKSDPIYGSPAFSCTATRQSPVGTYDIVITSGNLQTSDITNFKHGTLTINKAPLTITAESYTINQGDPLPTFECTYSGFKNSETNSVLTTQPSFSCNATSTSAPGTYDIIVSGAFAQNYSMTYVKGTLTILETIKDLSNSDITIDPIGSLTYNGLAQTPAVIVKDGSTTLTSGTDYTVSYSSNTNVGTATVIVTGMGNYTGTKTASFTINKAALTITAESYTINQGDPLPKFTCTYSGFVNGEDETVLTTLPTFSCSASSMSTPGEYGIIANGASAQNYLFNYVNGKLTIEQNTVVPSNVIAFADANVKAICVARWDTDVDGELSYSEAAAVTDLGTAFKWRTDIVSFTELQYFTGLNSIVDNAFSSCSGLTSVTIPNSVTTIGSCAFFGCTDLVSVTIPNSVTAIGGDAFYECSSLTAVYISDIFAWCNISFDDNPLCYAHHLFLNGVEVKDLIIPNSVTSISNKAFWGAYLLSVPIHNGLYDIGAMAFCNCPSLTNVIFEDGDSPLQLGMGCYEEYYYDEFRPDPTEIDFCSLFGKSPLTTLYIGRKLALKNFDWYSDKKYEENNYLGNIFYDYFILGNNTLNRVEIGNLVTTMPNDLFIEKVCSINEVNYHGNISQWCNITFANEAATPFFCSNAILYLDGSPLHSQVNIPEGATKIGAYSFYGQNGVSTITIPSTVTIIEPHAFDNQNISDVFIYSDDVISLTDANSFNSTANIYVPDAVFTNYRTANVWSQLASRIYPLGFLTVTVDLVAMQNSPALLPALNALEVVNGEYRISALTSLKIRGTMNGWDILMIRNKMPNLRYLDLSEATILDNDGGYEYYTGNHVTAPNTISTHSFFQLNSLRTLILPENAVTIEGDAVSGCQNLQRVVLPQQLTTIGTRAFADCPKLREVLYMPETCTYIGSGAFQNTGLISIDISKGVTIIGSNAFYGCSSLSEVVFREGLESIESSAFSGCSSLKEITFGKGLKTIGSSAFYGSGVTKLVLPTTLKKIEADAFRSCSQLREIDFAEGLTEIGSGAFQNCLQLRELHLPTSLRTIDGSAFRYCNSLSEIHVPSLMHSIGDYAFKGCGLKSVYAYTIVPIQINQNTFDYNGVDLYAPDNSFYAYYLNTQWSQFQDVK